MCVTIFLSGSRRKMTLDTRYRSTRVVGALLCLNAKRRTRRILFRIWIIVVSLTICLIPGLVWNGSYSQSVSLKEMRKADGLSTMFCEQATVIANQHFNAYLLPSEPAIDKTYVTPLKFKVVSAWLYPLDYQYWGYYLLAGSRFTVRASVYSPHPADLYLLQGDDALQDWISLRNNAKVNASIITDVYHELQDWLYQSDRFKPSATISAAYQCDNDKWKEITSNIDRSGAYYIALHNPYYDSAKPGAWLHLYRTNYALSNNKVNCTGYYKCSFPLKFGSDETVVYYVDKVDPVNVVKPKVVTACKPRIWVYVVLFGLAIMGTYSALSCIKAWLEE